jgi:site-specific recombinase XerD
MASELRTRFEQHLILNRLSPKTREAYVRTVVDLAKCYKQSPDKLNNEQIQQYLFYLLEHRKLKWSSCDVAFSALYCFYSKFLKWPKAKFSIPPRPRSRKLPQILTQKQVGALIDGCHRQRDRTMLYADWGSAAASPQPVSMGVMRTKDK